MPDAVAPTTAAGLADAVRAARAAGHAVYPRGGGTQTHIGYPPARPGIVLDCRGVDRLVDHAARDLTVTAEAGITVAALQQTLAAEGQRLPVDIPRAAEATLGGSVAANVAGPRRLGVGTLRDYLLGVSFVTDGGDIASAGGRVVKNVAGYDLMKLHTGALGTLGVLTQLTFKVTPVPEAQALVAFAVGSAAVGPTLDRLHASGSRPVVAELWNAAFARIVGTAAGIELPTGEPWLVVAGFEEKRTTVDWQVGTLLAELRGAPVRGVAEFRGADGDKLWAVLPELPVLAEATVSVTASVLPSRLAALAVAVGQSHPDLLIHAHALTGVLHAHWPAARADEWSVERVSGLVAALLPPEPGNLAVTRCPSAWAAVLPIWGRPRNDLAVMSSVKRALDPDDLFNPGRLFR